MLNEIASLLNSHSRFAVVTHVNPDGDAIGSLLGTHLALTEMGKLSVPLMPDRIPAVYAFLPGLTSIVADPDHLEFEPEWIVSVDVAEEHRIAVDLKKLRTRAGLLNIDHHPTNPGFGDVNLVRPQARSTAELVHKIIKETGHILSADVGKCLYTGLITDTGGFRFSGVNADTLRTGAEMLESGFDPYEVCRCVFEEHPLPRLHLERTMFDRAEILLNGRLVLSTLYAEDFRRIGARMSDAENLVDRLRCYAGVSVGLLMTEVSADLVRASFRSKDEVDVSAVAGLFGGGGHRNAAGLKTSIPLASLKNRIIDAIERALPQMSQTKP